MASTAPWRPAELSRALRDLAAAATHAGAGSADRVHRLQEALTRVSVELSAVAGADSPASLAELPYVQPGVGATLQQVTSALLRLEAVSGALKALLLGPVLCAAKCLAPSDTSLELLKAIRAAADLVAAGGEESLDTKFLAGAWEGIVTCVLCPSSGSADTLPPSFSAYGTQLAHALAAHVAAHASQAACAVAGAPARSKLAAFYAGHLLKLVAKQPRIGVCAWSSLVKAASDVRLAVWVTSDVAGLDAACLARTDACLYRTLESMATTDSAQCDSLLTALCDTAAASSHAARVATFCDAVLARLSHHGSPALAALALRHMDWALGVGTTQGMPLLLRLPPPPTANLRAALRHGLGHALASAASHGSTHWHTAEQFLISSCVASHPMKRALCLDAWCDLVASAPPELGEQHLRLVLTLAHATAEAAQRGEAHPVAVHTRLCHAAVRILEACPDGGQRLEETYARLFMAPQLCTSALVMLHAPFPLRRLRRGDTASHAAHSLLSVLAPHASSSPEHAAKAALAVMRTAMPAPSPASLAPWFDPCLAVLSQCGQTSPRQHAACDACCTLLVRLCAHVDSSRAMQCAEAVLRHAEAGCIGARNALPSLLAATTQEVPGRGVPEALTQRVFDSAFALQAWPHCLDACAEFVARCRVAPGGAKSLGQFIPPHAALGGREGVKAIARRPLMPDFRQAAAAGVEWGADTVEAQCLENDAAALNQGSQTD
jgi:hypothetical protein